MADEMTEEEKRLLLFDETPEYLAMSKDKQKEFFKTAVKKLNKKQMSKRIAHKMKNHGKAVTSFKKMENVKQMKENKMDIKKSSNNKNNKKRNNKRPVPQGNNKKIVEPLPDKKVKKEIKAKYKDKKLATGFIEGKAGPTKRKTTKRHLGNAHILDFLKESDAIEEKKRQEEEEEEAEEDKNAREQKKIKESNIKLRQNMENVTTKYYGYHNLNKKKNEDLEKTNEFSKNKAFDSSNLFDNENMHSRSTNINPALQARRLDLETPGVVNLNSLLSDMQRGLEMESRANFSFRKLGGFRSGDEKLIMMSNKDIIRVFQWHETRLNKYKEALELSQRKFDNYQSYIEMLEDRLMKIENKTVYTDYDTLVVRDRSIRKIQSTWRRWKFITSYYAIRIQRWFRYRKNVASVQEDVKTFFNNIKSLQDEAEKMKRYLGTFNQGEALPLDKLKRIKMTMEKRLNKVGDWEKARNAN